MIDMKNIKRPGAELKKLRQEQKLSQPEFAAVVGTCASKVCLSEKGKRAITAQYAVALEAAFPQYSADHWVVMQALWDLAVVRARKAGFSVSKEVDPDMGQVVIRKKKKKSAA